jgi:hypothetical protein
MKKYSIVSMILLMLVAALQISSCTDTDPNDPETNTRDQFLGTWTVDESCVRLNYEVIISADSDNETKVWLDNFAFTGPGYPPAYGMVNGDQIKLPEQSIGDNWTINGIGTMQSTGKITWAYYIEIGATGSNCEAEYDK